MIQEALNLHGTAERPGKGDNPAIIGWADEVGADIRKIYFADDTPWCGLFMAVVAKRAGKRVVKDPLWALNWGTFGKFTEEPMLGDVLVFVRKTREGKKAGHVGLYVGEDESAYHVLGGNQGDCVCVQPIAKSRLYAARRPLYNQQPSNVRKIPLAAVGSLSTDES
ncbi:TIGR02594 family protein [Pontibacter pamirensis]|uniref:TIGR02594 family protein n=1 Tax=Pontibacter pamirensis TaxID=2562824 RepID=UPI00192E7521|nr:TIGR02594 family protein [Pontibacter pamirensis]